MFKAKFWGVRGSVPSPLRPDQIRAKVKQAIEMAARGEPIPFAVEATYGGNTTCVEVNADDQQFILDMGTGVRELGKAQMAEAFRTKNTHLSGIILQSHVHWDHIQGVPFWQPLYLPRRMFHCEYQFFGGKSWDSQLDLVYRGQMNPPVFPVSIEELEETAMRMKFKTLYDGWTEHFQHGGEEAKERGRMDLAQGKKVELIQSKVLARKLFHPQETFGYRIEYQGKKIAFTTDHEPYAGGVPKPLMELVNGVDLWITDCQYSHDDYIGKNGVQKMGWGHSFPEYIALVAKEAQPKHIVTTHHDPDSDDFKIEAIARQVADLSGIDTLPAYEGLAIEVG